MTLFIPPTWGVLDWVHNWHTICEEGKTLKKRLILSSKQAIGEIAVHPTVQTSKYSIHESKSVILWITVGGPVITAYSTISKLRTTWRQRKHASWRPQQNLDRPESEIQSNAINKFQLQKPDLVVQSESVEKDNRYASMCRRCTEVTISWASDEC